MLKLIPILLLLAACAEGTKLRPVCETSDTTRLEAENQKLKQDLEAANKLNAKLYDKLSETIHLKSKVQDMFDKLDSDAEEFAIEVCSKVELAFGTEAMLELFPKVCEP